MRYLIIAAILITVGLLLFALNWDHARDIEPPAPETPPATAPAQANAPES